MLVGCGGGTDLTQGMSADQLLSESVTRTGAVASYRFGLDLDATLEVSGAGAFTGILSTPLEISGEGAATKSGDFSLDATADLGPAAIQANITRVGDALYLSVLGQAIRLDVPAATVRSLNAARLAPAIAGWITDAEIVGTEEVDGVPVVHIRGRVDEKALADSIAGLVEGLGAGDAVNAGAGGTDGDLDTGVVDVWVGQEDLLIHRTTAEVVSKDQLATIPAVGSLDIRISVTLSEFGATVAILAPSGARTVNLDSIASLLGG